MSLKSYLISRDFLKNVLIAVLGTFVVLLITLFILRIYTHHGKSFAVPDFNGMNMEQVEEMAELKNLRAEIIDSLYLNNVEPGSVVDQVPEAGSLVKKNRRIFLTICAINPEQVAMPKLTDISYRQALNIMQSMGLNAGQVNYVPSEYPNLVLAQQMDSIDIEEGTLVNKGSYIDLTVGEVSSGEKTLVPDLIRLNLEQAKLIIAEYKLNTGAIIYDDSFTNEEDSLNAQVWSQRPESGSDEEIELGSSIDIWLTVDEDRLEKGN